jgi:hypothetical protein
MAKDLVEGERPPRDSSKDRSQDLSLGHMAQVQTCDLTNTKEEFVLKKVALIICAHHQPPHNLDTSKLCCVD